ncbi:HDOD domain-containing protein [Marinobacterium sp. D7]|uniref:HDOD domain-containing protein n=1 Tax=Marinobacterium ramblicola TaxID=2849041 RepID=UPI001C2D612B|nr:HDOD domain-containing protein [Marinobacterium ramblicola]MBV1790496.1 HDOD domain-containing protein [Marinobacterium ramblicola]
MSSTDNLYGVEAWAGYLGEKTLPVRASTLVRLKRALSDDRTTLAQLAHQVRMDPVLSLHVTRQAQIIHEAKGSSVTSVDHAIASLGFGQIETLASELDTIKIHPHSVAQRSFFRSIAASNHASVQAADWVHHKQLPYAEEARLAALFYGLVHWMLWLYAPLHKHRFAIAVIDNGESPVDAERRIFGGTTQEIGRALADRWKLTELTVLALDHETSPSLSLLKQLHLRALKDPRLEEDDLRQLNHLVQQHYFPVKLANWMALNVSRGWDHNRAHRTFDIISDYLDLPLPETMARLHRNCAVAARSYYVPGIMTPAAELILLPGAGRLPHRLSERELSAYAGRFPEPVEHAPMPAPEINDPLAEETVYTPELLNPHIYNQVLKRFQNGYELYTKPAHILHGLLQGVHGGIGLERAMLLLVHPQSQSLRAARAIGISQDDPMTHLEIDLKQARLFAKLCEKPSMLQIDETNRSQIHASLPEQHQGWFGQNDGLIMSIFRGRTPVALIYADRQGANTPLVEFHQQHFRELCQAASQALKQIGAAD